MEDHPRTITHKQFKKTLLCIIDRMDIQTFSKDMGID
jgi:hypothetical protein